MGTAFCQKQCCSALVLGLRSKAIPTSEYQACCRHCPSRKSQPGHSDDTNAGSRLRHVSRCTPTGLPIDVLLLKMHRLSTDFGAKCSSAQFESHTRTFESNLPELWPELSSCKPPKSCGSTEAISPQQQELCTVTASIQAHVSHRLD